MKELTQSGISELEDRVDKRLELIFPNVNGEGEMTLQIARIAARATIATIREYEQMQAEKQD